MTNQQKAESIALALFVNVQPDHWTYDQVIEHLKSDPYESHVKLRDYFEDWYPPAMAELLEELVTKILDKFGDS